jgi:hypothetical protein
MNTRIQTARLDVLAFGWGVSAALVVLFVLCLIVALVLPGWPASHGWIGLFSVAPPTSFRVWIEGILFSLVFGWIIAIVLGRLQSAESAFLSSIGGSPTFDVRQ